MMSDDKTPPGYLRQKVVHFFGICAFENIKQASILVNRKLGIDHWALV